MAFDIKAARAAGATDDQIKDFFRDRIDVDAALEAGATLEQISEFLTAEPERKPLAESTPAPTPPAEPEPTPQEPPAPEPLTPGVEPTPVESVGVADTAPPEAPPRPELVPTEEAPPEEKKEPVQVVAGSTFPVFFDPNTAPTREPGPGIEVEAKALVTGTADLAADLTRSVGNFFKRHSGPIAPTMGFLDPETNEKLIEAQIRHDRVFFGDFDKLSVGEMQERLRKNSLERFSDVIRGWVPDDFREEAGQFNISKDDLEGSARAITTATAQTLPRLAFQAGLTAAAGPVIGVGSSMMIEGGSFLNTSDQMAAQMEQNIIAEKGELSPEDRKMLLQFQVRMEEMAPMFGMVSGTIEYGGNAFGALAKEGKKKLVEKTIRNLVKSGRKARIFRELAGFIAEGGEEVLQGGLRNILIHKAISDVRKANKDAEFAPDWKPESLLENFITGVGVSVLTRGAVKGVRGLTTQEQAEEVAQEAAAEPTEAAQEVEEAPAKPEDQIQPTRQFTDEELEKIPEETQREFGLQRIDVRPPTQPLRPPSVSEMNRIKKLQEKPIEERTLDDLDKLEDFEAKVDLSLRKREAGEKLNPKEKLVLNRLGDEGIAKLKSDVEATRESESIAISGEVTSQAKELVDEAIEFKDKEQMESLLDTFQERIDRTDVQKDPREAFRLREQMDRLHEALKPTPEQVAEVTNDAVKASDVEARDIETAEPGKSPVAEEPLPAKPEKTLNIDDVLENDEFGKVSGNPLQRKAQKIENEKVLNSVANKDLGDYDAAGNQKKPEVQKEQVEPVDPPKIPLKDQTDFDKWRTKADKDSRKRQKERNNIPKFLQWAKTNFIDINAPVVAKLKGSETGQDAIDYLRLSRGAQSTAKSYFVQAKRDIYQGMNRNDKQNFEDLIVAFRSIEVEDIINKRTKEIIIPKNLDGGKAIVNKKAVNPGGLTREQMQAQIDAIKARDPESYKKAEKALNKFWGVMNEQVNIFEREGIISSEFADFLRTNHKHYSPKLFVQHIDPTFGTSYDNTGKKVNDVSDSGIRTLEEGSTQDLVRDSEFLLAQVLQRTQNRVAKNRANVALAEWVREFPDNDLGVRLEKEFEINELGEKKPPKVPDGFVRIRAWQNGEATTMIMPDETAKHWVLYDSMAASSLLRAVNLGTGTGLLKFMATGANPEFSIRNLLRDIPYTWLKNHTAYSSFLPFGMAQLGNDLKLTAKDAIGLSDKPGGRFNKGLGPLTRMFIERGGETDYLAAQGVRFNDNFGKVSGSFREGWEATKTFMSAAGIFTERWVRVSLMRRMLDKSLPGKGDVMTRLNAMPAGKEKERIITRAVATARANIDFAQGGAVSKSMDAGVPYFNASLQGTRGMVQGYKADPKIFAIKAAQIIGFAYGLRLMQLWSAGDDDEERERDQAASAQQRATNWVFPLPEMFDFKDAEGKKRHSFLALAKDHGQTFFSAIGEATATAHANAAGLTTEEVDYPNLVSTLMAGLPAVPGKTLPPVMDALLVYSMNFDTWTKRDIWVHYQDVSPYKEFYERTPEFYVALGEKTGLSPARLEAAMKKVLPNNLWTEFGLESYKRMSQLLGDDVKEEARKTWQETIAQTPFLRKVYKVSYPVRVKGIKDPIHQATIMDELGVKATKTLPDGREIPLSNTQIKKAVEEAKIKRADRQIDNDRAYWKILGGRFNTDYGVEKANSVTSFIKGIASDAIETVNKSRESGKKLTEEQISEVQFIAKEAKRFERKFKKDMKVIQIKNNFEFDKKSGNVVLKDAVRKERIKRETEEELKQINGIIKSLESDLKEAE